MHGAQKHGRVSIGAVVAALRQSYPDISHSSVRFLEREGLINPERTAGGHRLYSSDDIDRIHRIKTWQAQRLSLDEIRERLEAQSALPPPATLAERFLQAALTGEVDAARIVLQADDLGMPLASVFQSVLQPALLTVGEQWAAGILRVGQEHEITEIVRELIAELSRRHAAPPAGGPPILAACVPGERHDLGLRMVVALLRSRGIQVHFLGADVTTRFLLEEIRAREPAIVLLSATMQDRLPAIRETALALCHEAIPIIHAVFLGGQATHRQMEEVEQLGVIPITGGDLDRGLQTILAAWHETWQPAETVAE